MRIHHIIEAVQAQGINPEEVRIEGTLRHLPAGEEDHYTGKRVQRFEAVATPVRFFVQGHDAPFMEFSCQDATVGDKDAFWQRLNVPSGVNAEVAATLMKHLVDDHRELTGEIRGTFSMIECDPAEIVRITSTTEPLVIGLKHLCDFIASDERFFDSLLERARPSDEAAKDKRCREFFEAFKLTKDYRNHPCEYELYRSLRDEYSEGSHLGLGFGNYYNWSIRSEELFDAQGDLTGKARERAAGFLRDAAKDTQEISPEWMEGQLDLINRWLQVHPRHHERMQRFAESIAGDLEPGQAPAKAKGARP